MKQFITQLTTRMISFVKHFCSHILADISYQLLCYGIIMSRKLSRLLVKKAKVLHEKFSLLKFRKRGKQNYDENDKN